MNYAKEDSKGNILYNEGNSIYLKLKDEKRKRRLGTIIEKDDKKVFVSIRQKKKHLFRKDNSWGMCYEILKDLPSLDVNHITIYDQDDDMSYRTTPTEWLKNGKCLNFAKDGFELQGFLCLEGFNA